jgi:hypothetical protein
MQGAVSFSQHTLMRDLLQAVWRLRGLKNAQRVHFVVTSDDAKIIAAELERMTGQPIKGNLKLADIVLYALLNQAKRQGNDNYRALGLKMKAVLLEKVLTSLHEAFDVEEMVDIFATCRSLFETEQNLTPYQRYSKPSQEAPKEVVVDRIVKDFLNSPLVQAFATHPTLSARWNHEDIVKEIQEIAKNELPNLTNLLKEGTDYGKERTVETEAQEESLMSINRWMKIMH